MRKRMRQAGFTSIELTIVASMSLVIASFSVPQLFQVLRTYRISGDARSINGEIVLAKMRAAANFTRARTHFDFDARTFATELWDKTTSTWIPLAVGTPQLLSRDVSFGIGSMTAPPPDSQALLEQSPACREGDTDDPGGGAEIAQTACIVYNSCGFPVDDAGTATGAHAIYVTDGSAVQGVTVSSGGLTRTWRGDSSSSDYWIRR